MQKNKLRKEYLDWRNSLSIAERKQKDELLFNRIKMHKTVAASKRISCYVSYGSEINTREILSYFFSTYKEVLVPRIISKSEGMEMVEITSLHDLKPNKYGILEPDDSIKSTDTPPELTIVPGLVFDKNGYRIGYGGGFYDRYLSKFENYTLSMAYNRQMVSELPHDKFDIPVKEVIVA